MNSNSSTNFWIAEYELQYITTFSFNTIELITKNKNLISISEENNKLKNLIVSVSVEFEGLIHPKEHPSQISQVVLDLMIFDRDQ